ETVLCQVNANSGNGLHGMVSLHRSYDTLCYPLCSGGTIPSLPNFKIIQAFKISRCKGIPAAANFFLKISTLVETSSNECKKGTSIAVIKPLVGVPVLIALVNVALLIRADIFQMN
ncbi:MAG: hypothetical protein PHW09_09525, partial [Desulfovibrio desulfuricans]|nr:hypothetical protein [Desulfovibrio desulfuricans]